MAKRKSMNRRSARYSRSSIETGYLDPDTNIIDPDQPLWWNNLENNTINRHSMNSTHIMNYTKSLLNSNSTVRSMPASTEWWKELEVTDTIVPIPLQDTPDTTRDGTNEIADSSLSGSEKDARILRKKKSLRILARRSKGNSAFLSALENSKEIDLSSPELKNVSLKAPESKTTASNECIASDPLIENHDNSSISGSVILKSKPRILRKTAVRNLSDNDFLDVLINEPLHKNHNDSSHTDSVAQKSKSGMLQKDVPNRTDNVSHELLKDRKVTAKRISDNHHSSHRNASRHIFTLETQSNEDSITNKSNTLQMHSGGEADDESIHLTAPNAHSSGLNSSHSSAVDGSDNESKTHTNIVMPKSRFLRRTRKSSMTNTFENVLAADYGAGADDRVESVRRSTRLTGTRETKSSNASNTLEKSSTGRISNRISQTVVQSPGRNRKSNSLSRSKNEVNIANALVRTMGNVSAEQESTSPHSIQTSYRESELPGADTKTLSKINKSVATESRSLKRSSPLKLVSTMREMESSEILQRSVSEKSDSSRDKVSPGEGNVNVIDHEPSDILHTHSNIPSPKRKRSKPKSDHDVSNNQDSSLRNKDVDNSIDAASRTDLKNSNATVEDVTNLSSDILTTKHAKLKMSKKDVTNRSIENNDIGNTSKKLTEKIPNSFVTKTQFTDSDTDEERPLTSRVLSLDKSKGKTIKTRSNSSKSFNKSDTKVTPSLKANIQPIDIDDAHVSRVPKEPEKRTSKSTVPKLSLWLANANAENAPSRSEKSKSDTSKANFSKMEELFAESSSDEDILHITNKSNSRTLISNISRKSEESTDVNKDTLTSKKRVKRGQKLNVSTVKEIEENVNEIVQTPASKSGDVADHFINPEIASSWSETPKVGKDTDQSKKFSEGRNIAAILAESPNKAVESSGFIDTQIDAKGVVAETNGALTFIASDNENNKSTKSKEIEGRASKLTGSKISHAPPASSGDMIESEQLNSRKKLSKLSTSKVIQTSSLSTTLSPPKNAQVSLHVASDPEEEDVFKVPEITSLKGRRSSVQQTTQQHSVPEDNNVSIGSKNLQRSSPSSSVADSIQLRLESGSDTDANTANNKSVLNTANKQPTSLLKPTLSGNRELSSDQRRQREEFSNLNLLPIAHSSGINDSLAEQPLDVASIRRTSEAQKTMKKQSTASVLVDKEKDTRVVENRTVTKKITPSERHIQDFFKVKEPNASQPASHGASSSQGSAEDRLSGVKKELERIRLKELEHMKVDRKPEPEKRVFSKISILKKKILETKENAPAKSTKETPGASDNSNIARKRPKAYKPKPWATDKLYNHLWKCMEPKYKMRTKVRSEKFVRGLAEVIKIVTRRKKYDNYKVEVDVLMKEMARLGIIRTPNDFYIFCQEFLPFNFRLKVTPILLPGNKRTIPYDPSKLHTPIMES